MRARTYRQGPDKRGMSAADRKWDRADPDRRALRSSRCCETTGRIPKGGALLAQGHHLRRAVGHRREGPADPRGCRSTTGSAGWCQRRSRPGRPAGSARHAPTSSPNSCTTMPARAAATPLPTLPGSTHSHHLRDARPPLARTGICSPTGQTTSSRSSTGTSSTTHPTSCAHGQRLEAYLDGMVTRDGTDSAPPRVQVSHADHAQPAGRRGEVFAITTRRLLADIPSWPKR